MKNKWIMFVSVVFTFIFLVSGCKENNSTEPTEKTDQEAMTLLVANDALFSPESSLLDDGNPNSSLQKISAVIIPRAWGRKILSFNRNIAFTVVSDSTATATVTNTISGYICIYPKDTTKQLTTKDFTEVTTRNVKFVRRPFTRERGKNWKISEISILQGGTTNNNITIQRLVFYIGGDTLEIENPLDYYLKVGQIHGRGGLHELVASSVHLFKIQVKVKSTDPDSDIVVAHRPVWASAPGLYRRGAMKLVSDSTVSNGDGTFSRVYENSWQGAWAGRHHVMVNAITRESIFTDSVAFSSQVWGIPYIVQ